jgi:hypothetical protein
MAKLTAYQLAEKERLAYLLRLSVELDLYPDWATANAGHFINNPTGTLSLVLSAKVESIGDRLLSVRRVKVKLICCRWADNIQFSLNKEQWLAGDWRLATEAEYPLLRNPFSWESINAEEKQIAALIEAVDNTPF